MLSYPHVCTVFTKFLTCWHANICTAKLDSQVINFAFWYLVPKETSVKVSPLLIEFILRWIFDRSQHVNLFVAPEEITKVFKKHPVGTMTKFYAI